MLKPTFGVCDKVTETAVFAAPVSAVNDSIVSVKASSFAFAVLCAVAAAVAALFAVVCAAAAAVDALFAVL
jgi:hypothetical protein